MTLQELGIKEIDRFLKFNSGPMDKAENIIIHGISDPRKADAFSVDVVLNLFEEYGVSAHFLIDRAGAMYQLIPPHLIAWHAGTSEYNGKTGLNSNSIGIELIGNKFKEYTNPQYNSLTMLGGILAYNYNIKLSNVKGHQMVSDSDVRDDPKWDPGRYFDWIRFGHQLTNYVQYLNNDTGGDHAEI